MNWFRNRLALTTAFASALALSAGGVFFLVTFLNQAPAKNGRPLVPLVACWSLAQAVLVLTSIAAFRAVSSQHHAESQLQEFAQLQHSITDSPGVMIIASDLAGRMVLFNPAAEALLGYSPQEMLGATTVHQLFSEEELTRVSQLLADALRGQPQVKLPAASMPDLESAGANAALPVDFVRYVLTPPEVRQRGLEMEFCRKNGTVLPVVAYLSGLTNAAGEIAGILALCTDTSAARRAEHAFNESEERYRDLFENSDEMIATLSPRGRYLYVNPAWQARFGAGVDSFESVISFESVFAPGVQAEAAALFRRALNGEAIEGALLRMPTADGDTLEVEGSLGCRYNAGRPVSVRCIFRDVTERNRRERRLAMQLVVSQIVGESTNPEETPLRVLESLGLSLGWDMANLWVVDEQNQHMVFRSTWSAPGRPCTEFLRECQQRVFNRSQGLLGAIWAMGSPRWIEDVRADFSFERRYSARLDGLVTGWGVPVRVGNQVIAVVEFFGRQRQPEDREIMATVETVCTSLGQFMARSAQESRVRELNRQKEFILNSVADGIFGADPEGRVVFVNPAAAQMLEVTESEVIGSLVHDVVHGCRPENDPCGERCRARRWLQGMETSTAQDVFYRGDGSAFPVEFTITPMGEQDALLGSVMSFRDISQRYALDRMKDEFVSTVSHELRTPLTSIRGALGLLAAGLLGDVSEKAGNLLRIAVSNSDRLVRLINDILDLERMQSGRAPLSFRSCALNELARQAIDAIHPMAESARVLLSLDAGPTWMEADADRLLQVMTNLLSNAVKFSPPGSLVLVQLRSGSEGVTLSVIDQGRGIPADKLETIFDRFQQVDASDSRQKGGTGLGLAICRTIVLQHGGRIWAERNAEIGSTFRVFLPLRVEHHPTDSLHVLPNDGGAQGTILVCDPEPAQRRTIAENLRQHGYRVMEAETATQAAELARQVPPEAVLLDLSLQEHQDGWEALRLLKNDPATASIAIVVLSMADPEGQSGLAGDADAWLQKPLDDKSLLQELAVILRGRNDHASVLLVEDDEDLARIIAATFETTGVHVLHAPTRRRAIDICRTTHPDLMILDLSLPDGDGFNVVDWLRRHNELRALPLVVYSAREVADGERPHLRLGPTHFLTKGKVQPQEVERLVLTMLRDRRRSGRRATDRLSADRTQLRMSPPDAPPIDPPLLDPPSPHRPLSERS